MFIDPLVIGYGFDNHNLGNHVYRNHGCFLRVGIVVMLIQIIQFVIQLAHSVAFHLGFILVDAIHGVHVCMKMVIQYQQTLWKRLEQ